MVDYDGVTIPEGVREEVLARDGWVCQNCGDNHLGNLRIHHVIFRSQSGSHHPDNLITVCFRCHEKFHHNQLRTKRIDGVWYMSERHND